MTIIVRIYNIRKNTRPEYILVKDYFGMKTFRKGNNVFYPDIIIKIIIERKKKLLLCLKFESNAVSLCIVINQTIYYINCAWPTTIVVHLKWPGLANRSDAHVVNRGHPAGARRKRVPGAEKS